MDNTLVVCGGTGAHTALAFVRLHILGYTLGFFERGGKPLDFPTIYLVDQDAGDGAEELETAWQLTKRLLAEHPGRADWERTIGRSEAPELHPVTPLPVGSQNSWSQRPNNTLENRFESSPYRDALISRYQQTIDYTKGMMGSPAVGALLFKLKEFDTNDARLNHDRVYGRLLESRGRIAVTGSGVGGTGASIAPTLAERLALGLGESSTGGVMAALLLEWFKFDEDEGDEQTRSRAQRRNRRMHENANSALEFYGQSLSQSVATVPIGMPKASRLSRRFTGDIGQPVRESFIHAVAALAAYRHFLGERPYDPGLYIMGAVERGRLAGGTAIPGGTLQSLANRAATVAELLEVWRKILVHDHGGRRVRPAIYEAVTAVSSHPHQVADHLGEEAERFKKHVQWMREVLGVEPRSSNSFSVEQRSRRRLLETRAGLVVGANPDPEAVASALFHWTAAWVRHEATSDNGLVVNEAPVGGGHWPDLTSLDGLGVSPSTNGDLTRIADSNRDAVLEAFVLPDAVSVNGWPDPLSTVTFFREAIRKRNMVALRQLELLLVGVVSGELEVKRLDTGLSEDEGISLERLITAARRDGAFGLGELVVTDPPRDNRVVALSSPDTLFAPIPSIGPEESDETWEPLWERLTGADDGAIWSEAKNPRSWGEKHDQVILHILSWIAHLRRVHGTSAPPWTRVFDRHRGQEIGVPFGTGEQMKALWVDVGDRLHPIELHLPTTDIEEWVPPAGTPTLDEEVLFRRVPNLLEIHDDQGNLLYHRVEFQAPDRLSPLRGWWAEHLDLLKQRGEIHIWSRNAEGAVVLGMVDEGGLKAVTLADSRLLDRRTIGIKDTVPLRQDAVPTSSRATGSLLWPDLPIHSDYADLVQTSSGQDAFAALSKGEKVDLLQWQPRERQDDAGRLVVTWNLPMRGRKDPLTVEVRVQAPEKPEAHHNAHWMVWPRFRTLTGDRWRTYYVYQRSSHKRLRADTLWLRSDQGTHRLARTQAPERDVPTYPVHYQTSGNAPRHTGGPPLALVQRDQSTGEQGLYFVPLELLSAPPTEVKLAIDFGTSHSVAAAKVDGKEAPLRLAPELKSGNPSLSLHVSESFEHVKATSEEAGLLAEGAWLPTYTLGTRSQEGFLPSDLIFREEIKPALADGLEQWVPGHDYRIPPLDIGRTDLSKVLVTDFKWEAGIPSFRGKEAALQEHYLSMFLELVLAEVVGEHARGLPEGRVDLTFTYPLRIRRGQMDRYRQTIGRVLERLRAGTGLDLHLLSDVGTYDESRAARLIGRQFGEVLQVADLGGGTLDLLISAFDQPGTKFAEVTDSVRLGGNLLLRQIADNPDGLLPTDGNWSSNGGQDTETKLRAWMRTAGAPALFGLESDGDRMSLRTLGVQGFRHPSDGDRARHLIDRYFRLVVEYLARNLTAYLVHHWYPQIRQDDFEKLQISVQLRGNGWKMRYQNQDHTRATAEIQQMVRQRVLALWDTITPHSFPAPVDDRHWAPAQRYPITDPKAAPIRSVVGKSQPYEDAVRDGKSHTPLDLEVRRPDQVSTLPWGAIIPFNTGGSNHIEVQRVQPPIPLTRPGADRPVELQELDATHLSRINSALQDEGVSDVAEGTFHAPVGPESWETIFDSRLYWPES